MHHPQYILMDEPFSHLDQIQKEDLYNFTLALWQDYKPTILLVTHDIDEALYLSHQISFLSKTEHRIISTLNVKEFEAKHADDLVSSKSDANYLNHFNSVYTLYKSDGQQ